MIAGSITIAICTWNRAGLLRQTLESVVALRRPDNQAWDVLVVDNNSTDDTAAVVRSFTDRLPIRHVFEPVAGLSNARNRALDESSAAYLSFIDDDVQLDHDWLVSLVQTAERFPEAALVGGPVEPWWIERPDPLLAEVFWRLKIGFCGIDHGTQERLLPRGARLVGANMTYSRKRLGAVRFDPQLGRCAGNEKSDEENAVIVQLEKAGGVIAWSPGMRVRHYVDPRHMTLAYLRRVTVGDGRTAARLEGFGGDAPTVRGVPRWLLRQYIELRLKGAMYRLRGQRRRSLELLRDAWFLRGRIMEGWEIHREGRAIPGLKA